ncbi:ABC transporter substrate-binding protein [Clostridium sp. ZS2-4]|uniref:ABC transporter substrate-binding protein n=1 Tax=Clostridium sp. ZS2-4 TaxID=2987703 RepID=UPI00227BB9A3|nr:ABC transporter substrate-binding protein [Clostridium sp. ZS2-4]MCY6355619.1 ABC transporter substrate-binding protein [Clostridium sp. ZS2-4]
MVKKKILALGLTMLMSVGILAGCGNSDSKKETSKDNKQLQLTIYAGLMEDHAQKAIKEFEKETGIKTNMVRMSGGEILARITAEKGNTQASVWYGGPADTFIDAKGKGLLEKYVSPNAEKIPDKFKDKEGYWTGIYNGYLGFVCNGALLKEKGVQVPKSWEDLLKPEYKGQIVVANPGSSGTAYTLVSTLVQLWGEDKAMDYLKKLDGQIKQYPKTGSAPAQMAGMGEAMVGICFMHDGIKYKKQGYEDIVLSAPSEGTGYEIGAVGIIKNAPDMEAAQKFVDWALSKKAQELGQTVGSFQFLTNPDAQPPKEAEQLKNTNLINYDMTFAGENRARLVEAWHKATNK